MTRFIYSFFKAKIKAVTPCLLVIAGTVARLSAQSGVGISTQSISNGAVFEMGGQRGGLLIPRVSLTGYTDSATVPGTKTNGTLVYNAGTAIPEGFYFWRQNRWDALTTATSNLYTKNGALTGNRTVSLAAHPLELSGNTGRNAFILKRTDNLIEQGLAFKSSIGAFTASIFMDTPNGAPLILATGDSSTNADDLHPTISLRDDRSLAFSNYGQHINNGPSTRLLGVGGNGNVTEQSIRPFRYNMYNIDGTLTGERIINTADYTLRLTNTASRPLRFVSADPSDLNSPFKFTTSNAFDLKVNGNKSFSISSGYRIQADQYGTGSITGSAQYLLGFDAGGNVIETDIAPPGVQFYAFSYPAKPTPSTVGTETNVTVAKAGGYTGLLDYVNGAQATMQPSQDGFIIKMVGTYRVENAGTFAISSNSDDGARVYVDGTLILNAWQESGNIRGDGSVYLSKGKHKFTFYYYENAGGEHFTFRWEGTSPDGLSGTMLGSQFTVE